jgi:signal transduction histidine kinase
MESDERVIDLERRAAVLTQLTLLSTVLNSELELDRLLALLMDAAAEITQAEAASVLLWDRNTHELRFTATTTGTAAFNLIGQPVPLEGSIAGTVMREQRIVQVDDVERDPRHYSKVDEDTEFQTRSILGVPMMSKDRPIGVLEVLNKRQLPWTEDDGNYLSILAAQAAVAIDSAQMMRALQKANDELSELDKLKNDFISIASHELRTPLGVILGYASFLQETSDNRVSEHATKVVNSAMHLRQIIESLTNLRYLYQRQTEIQRQRMPLRSLMAAAESEMLTLSEAKGHTIDIALPPDGWIVNVDQIRMEMALTNLLNNAIRFTPAGGHITMRAEQHHGSEVWITVTDNGIGLAEEQIERVFEPFYQVEEHMTRKHGGLGIGLSIVKVLVEAHDGRVWAASPGLDHGSTFTLVLPLSQSDVS